MDGCVVDVKSCSSAAFRKYKEGFLVQDDPFGYLFQLDGYLLGSASDPLVTVKDKGYIFAVDKTLGHMALYEHDYRPGYIERRISNYKRIVERSEPPACTCGLLPHGVSGNLKLDVAASYSPYKFQCFPNLRTFLYSERGQSKPVYLVKVVREPDVPEITRKLVPELIRPRLRDPGRELQLQETV